MNKMTKTIHIDEVCKENVYAYSKNKNTACLIAFAKLTGVIEEGMEVEDG